MTLAFHAVPPAGEWINDPNALVFADGEWRLFVQHRADAPTFTATGWARLSSPDLLHWTWDGPVIAPADETWAYSGSAVVVDGGLEVLHTAHRTGYESQVRRHSTDAGRTWQRLPLALPSSAAGANVRDPFVFGCSGDWWMLLARPCPWQGWETAERSELAILRSPDRCVWRQTGSIGPWHPPGVMWEVPVLIRAGDRNLLLVSLVDRRDGGAECSVQAWAGTLTATGFAVVGWPAEGRRVDLGPDFYAAIVGGGQVVGWLSSWATARTITWPGFAGGPISLPRRLTLEGDRLVHTVAPEIAASFSVPVAAVPIAGCGCFEIAGPFELTVASPTVRLTIWGDRAELNARREGGGLDWHRRYPGIAVAGPARLFVDGPAVEFFGGGTAISAAVPEGPLRVSPSAAWSVLS